MVASKECELERFKLAWWLVLRIIFMSFYRLILKWMINFYRENWKNKKVFIKTTVLYVKMNKMGKIEFQVLENRYGFVRFFS